jgi:minor fimbrial subunit
MKMKKMISLCVAVFTICCSFNAWSFTCTTRTGATIGVQGGSANVYVSLQPMLSPGENLVVDLSSEIFCHNDHPDIRTDYVSLQQGSSYGGALANFSGTVKYNGTSYPFPTTSLTSNIIYDSLTDKPWPTVLYLTPMSASGGVVIKAGSLVAKLVLHLVNNLNQQADYIWYIYANNDVVIPTGGCDVSARDVTVTLPDYPGTAAIPLQVHCAKEQNLGYYLTGSTVDSGNTIFANTASSSVAQGIGVQVLRSGSALSTNSTISLGTVGSSPVSLGLTASYERTSGQVTAGNVQSIIGVTFVYQ